jgi:hypothetical protein
MALSAQEFTVFQKSADNFAGSQLTGIHKRPSDEKTMNELDKLQDLLAELKAEHRDMDDAIHALSQRGVPDMIQIQRLKKRKLVLRDEIAKVESKMLPDIIA